MTDQSHTPQDLIERCRELLEWSATGLLAGGKGGAVRALADRLEEKVGSNYALSLAESQTKDEAMRAVVNSLPSLVKALEEILEAEAEFRSVIPVEWEGDPLSDACGRARQILSAYRGEGK